MNFAASVHQPLREHFVVKGAMLVALWGGLLCRATREDLSGAAWLTLQIDTGDVLDRPGSLAAGEEESPHEAETVANEAEP
jgi:hypothetical protein